MDFSNYLFRPHALGKIMAGMAKPLSKTNEDKYQKYLERHKGEGKKLTVNQLLEFGKLCVKRNMEARLTDGAKKYLDTLIVDEYFGRAQHFTSKQTDKGTRVEEKAITLYSQITGKLLFKNTERRKNEFLNGECDNINQKVRDFKSSYSYETFPLFDTKIPDANYMWQLDGYMDLWDVKQSELVYVLVDTPIDILEKEFYTLDKYHSIMYVDGTIKKHCIPLVQELINNHLYTLEAVQDFCNRNYNVSFGWFADTFKEIPPEFRVKVFHHNYDEDRNKAMKQMIKLARMYMNDRLKSVMNEVKYHKLKNIHDERGNTTV